MKRIPVPVAAVGLTILLTLSIISCSKSDDTSSNNSSGGSVSCNGAATSFATNVLPLFQTKCSYNSGCHGAGASNSGGPLTNYTQIKARVSNIKTQVSTGQMPQAGSLSTAEKATIICWIDAGAPQN